jgi:uncharacterized protein YlxP (DUF503 family)
MVTGVLRLDVHVPDAQSLKDKRAVVRRLRDQIRGRFNVGVAEVDANDRWQRASLGIAALGDDQSIVEGVLRQVTAWVRGTHLVELIQAEEEYVS